MKNGMILACLLAIGFSSAAQTLPRRSFLGIRMENITDDAKRIMGITESGGVLIQGTVPGSTAEAAGMKKGDILLSINGRKMDNVEDAVSFVGQQKGGSDFSYELIREQKKLSGKYTFRPLPEEKYADIEMEYAAVKSSTGLQRIIISKPKMTGRLPVIAFIGGIGCYSLDSPLDTSRNEVQLVNKLVRSGYMVVRLEKPGIGDGAGYSKKCEEISFNEEKDSYVQAINDLKGRADVLPDNVYIIGHSMGGVMAPMVAAETPVKGIIAYGTIGSNFIEYLAKTRRTIGAANNWPQDEIDSYVRDACECSAYYFVEKMTSGEAAGKKPICGEYMSVFDLRSRKYNDELYALNIPALWKPYGGKALLMWGNGDFIAAKEDHEILLKAVNESHPGQATIAIVDADHGMNHATSFGEAATSPGRYNPEVGERILEWLKKLRS